MPFVQIDLPAATSPDAARRIADAVHDAMVETIGIPVDDRFQVIALRDATLRIFDRGYLGVTRSDACVFVRITLKSGRSADQKRALYRQIAAKLEMRANTRPGDVMVILNETQPIDWSFGHGEAQIAPVDDATRAPG